MGRILFWLAIGFGLIMLARVLAGKRRGPEAKPGADPSADPNTTNENPTKAASAPENLSAVTPLLPCPSCGLHMAQEELAQHVLQHKT